MSFRIPSGLRSRGAIVATLSMAMMSPLSAQAVATHEGAARVFAIQPARGFERQFEDGYRRHLGWHVRAGDPWSWYLWEVTNGPRSGLYVDGTFEHRWADFAAAVDPAGDGADNEVNVEPFVTRPWGAAWRRLGATGDDFGSAVERAPLMMVLEIRLMPSAADGVFEALDGRGTPAVAGDRPAWFALASGGDGPALIVAVPLSGWAAFAPYAGDPLRGALAAAPASRKDLYRAISEAATSIRSEIWRFRPDLSICRSPEARCHATLGASRSPSAAAGW